MGKAPAFQFYVKDWLTDPELRLASASTKGIWIDLLCYMWTSNCSGILELTNEQIMKLTGSKNGEVEKFLAEAKEFKFCDIFVTCHGLSQICNRRMSRDYKLKQSARLRQQRHREKQASNADVTPPSPTPTPSPSSPKNKYTDSFIKFWAKYPKKIGRKKAYVEFQKAKDKPPISELLKIIDRNMKSDQWQKDGGQYIPNPATWLHQGRWDDEMEASGQQLPISEEERLLKKWDKVKNQK